MAEASKIEWTDHTFNPWTGCTKVSPGCHHCYAEAWSKRSGHVRWGNNPRKRTTEDYWKGPRLWNARAARFQAQHGRRQRVFCASLADVFDNQVPEGWRADLFALVRATPGLDWLMLTKRPQNIAKMLPPDWSGGYPNVWLGMTAENQEEYDRRWPKLAAVPATIRFVSYEPAIGPLRLHDCGTGTLPDWIILGGESGGRARPMDPAWARDAIADCRRLGVAPFFKQWGTYANNPLVRERGMSVAEAKAVDAAGKGGGMVDGGVVREFPSADQDRTMADVAFTPPSYTLPDARIC
jgi:protein gp37